MAMSSRYPAVNRDETVRDVYHGHEITDPYRALEDPDSPATALFREQENALTQEYLSQASDFRAKVRDEVETLHNYDRYGVGWKAGEYFYYSHHVGGANQAVIMQAESLDSDNPQVFLDPNKLAEDGTASLGVMKWSENGRYVSYGIQRSGSDWADIHVMDAHSKQVLPDRLEWAKFYSIAWNHDNKGFYYTRYPQPDSLRDHADVGKKGAETDVSRDQAVYYHTVGAMQEEDRLVLGPSRQSSKHLYGLQVSDDGEYLVITVSEDCAPRNLFWLVNIRQFFGAEKDHLIKYVDTFEAQYSYVTNDDETFYILTNNGAPRNKLISVNTLNLDRSNWRDVVHEDPRNVLSSVQAVNFWQLAVVHMQDASEKISLLSLKSGKTVAALPLPDLGEAQIWGKRRYTFLMIKFSSFLYPGTVYYCDLTLPAGDGMRVFRQMVPSGFDPSRFRTKQVFYPSKDGTKIPMFIVGPKDEANDAKLKRPCLLYGYGGFCISLVPFFSVRFASWLQCLNGVVAVANLRGGDEYGQDWHNAGILDKKQNVFDDFQYAAKALAGSDLNLTVPSKLMIMGGSNGGLLVGACICQAPELFGAAVAQVGVLDMLRFTKFTIGSAWVSDYGDPENPEQFQHLIKYSPLHNTFSPGERGVPYPALLLTTGSHDDRVVPLHSLKFAATLQHKISKSAEDQAVQGNIPVLLRVDIKAGHGAGKPTSKIIDEISDTLTFAALALKLVEIN